MGSVTKHNLLIIIIFLWAPLLSFSQDTRKEAPKNWYQLDRSESGYYGISLDKAYQFLKTRKSKQVVVAVIDSGIDTLHESLKPILWHNPGEVPGNHKDDDHNGYADDVHGWNFIGGSDGRNVKEDTYEGARVYHRLKLKYGQNIPDETGMNAQQKAEVDLYKKVKEKIETDASPDLDLALLKRININLHAADSILQEGMKKKVFTGDQLESFLPTDENSRRAREAFLQLLKANNSLDETNKDFIEGFDQYITGEERKKEQKTNPPKDLRGEIVKDDELNINDRYYGNSDIMAGTPLHGTHCSGIIAAVKNNSNGIHGIADNVRIMMIRAVANGDEHDKDIAESIKYAVDNGARVISMSFGKEFSPFKKWVDDAVKYASSKGVLLVHAAGNDGKNIDSVDNFPNPEYADGSGRSKTFITVGASGDPSNGGILANFSNYGKKEVDIFAPGVKIYSTVPGDNSYANLSGTSMACPVVAGVAALIMEYFPSLTAQQVKYVIEKSAVPISEKVALPGISETNKEPSLNLSDISKSGGIINAYEAVKLAATLTGDNINSEPVIKMKTKITHKRLS